MKFVLLLSATLVVLFIACAQNGDSGSRKAVGASYPQATNVVINNEAPETMARIIRMDNNSIPLVNNNAADDTVGAESLLRNIPK